jgi:hypothetical protein
MVTYFNKKDLVSFGNYLLSEERKDLFASHPELGSTKLTFRLSCVHDSDFDNWKQKVTEKKLSNHYKPEIEDIE